MLEVSTGIAKILNPAAQNTPAGSYSINVIPYEKDGTAIYTSGGGWSVVVSALMEQGGTSWYPDFQCLKS